MLPISKQAKIDLETISAGEEHPFADINRLPDKKQDNRSRSH
jgi:hypothetical protein